IYLLYMIPIPPVSLVTIVCASAKIEWKTFLEIVLVSFIPMVLFFSFFGNRVSNQNIVEAGVLLIVLAVIGFLLYRWFKRIRTIRFNKKGRKKWL
ncbi:MAG: hypothetical protein KC535_02535, partial [Nanoarchaeota archaeon]|nr:hypothetical protein [Nanoarchaeota archaeon]